jgi:hypothetical protein
MEHRMMVLDVTLRAHRDALYNLHLAPITRDPRVVSHGRNICVLTTTHFSQTIPIAYRTSKTGPALHFCRLRRVFCWL